MKLTQRYPGTIDRLWSVFGTPDYPAAKYMALGALGVKMLRHESSASMIAIELERRVEIAAGVVPGWARSYVNLEQTVRHTSHWRRTAPDAVSGELKVGFSGLPVKVVGVAVIRTTGADSTQLTIDFDIQCRVPLVGGRIAKLVSEQIEQSFAADHQFTVNYIRKSQAA
jgi:hypothetical protein